MKLKYYCLDNQKIKTIELYWIGIHQIKSFLIWYRCFRYWFSCVLIFSPLSEKNKWINISCQCCKPSLRCLFSICALTKSKLDLPVNNLCVPSLQLSNGVFGETNQSELAAFTSYALAFPDNFLALVDTYDVSILIF